MITQPEPDILECEVKWALGSTTMKKASGADGIPAKLFQILKDDAVKVLHSICQQVWKTQQWPQDWKRSVFIPIPKKGNAKECSNYRTIALISHWRRFLRVSWTAKRSNQSTLKEINVEYSLEGLMLKLKLQYFGHLMQRANSLEKILMMEK